MAKKKNPISAISGTATPNGALEQLANQRRAPILGYTQNEEELNKSEDGVPVSISPLLLALGQHHSGKGATSKTAPKLSFTESPNNNYMGIFKERRNLLPASALKEVRVQDHLIASILRTRGNIISSYGHERKDRFDNGFVVEIRKEFEKLLTHEQRTKVEAKIKEFNKFLLNCGHADGSTESEKLNFTNFLYMQTMNLLTFGWMTTEVIYERQENGDGKGKKKFDNEGKARVLGFRPSDAGTIYRAANKGKGLGKGAREAASKLLQSMSGEKTTIDFSNFDEPFEWIQRVDGHPVQGFTDDEMLVWNFFPSTDIEHNGYPVTPIDTVVSCVTTHISIDSYTRLYFQNGRASKGILVIKSDEVNEDVFNNLKTQFNAGVNSVANSFRTPIFGMSSTDDVSWVSTVGEGLAGNEMDFLSDGVSRSILSTFGMSPDEIPGYSHLSRGTNSQTLSESNSEFKMTAARDTGLRPLVAKLQNFLNESLFMLIDPLLAKLCVIRLEGLDAQSREQESSRLAQDSGIHLTYNGVLKEVCKEPVGAMVGGDFPFSERIQLLHDKISTTAELRHNFYGDPTAIVDNMLNLRRDPFWLQWAQLTMQANPTIIKAYLAPRPYAMDIIKLNVQDMLDEDGE